VASIVVRTYFHLINLSQDSNSFVTKGQLVGTRAFSCTNVYNKKGRDPRRLFLPASDCLEKYNSFFKCSFPALSLVSGCKLSPTKMPSFCLANCLAGLRSPSMRTFMAWNVCHSELRPVLRGYACHKAGQEFSG